MSKKNIQLNNQTCSQPIIQPKIQPKNKLDQLNNNGVSSQLVLENGNKLVDQYLVELKKYQNKYGTNTTIYMQVGDFYEMYGAIKSNLTEHGMDTLQEVSQITNILIKEKEKVSLKDDKKSRVFMAGFPLYTLSKFLKIAVDLHHWHVVVIEQEKNIVSGQSKTTTEVTRFVEGVYSPGVSFDNNSETNNLVSIYFEFEESRFKKGDKSIFCGVSCIDSITGRTEVKELWNKVNYLNILVDDVRKFICFHNPKEIIIYHHHMDQLFQNTDLVSHLSLDNKNYTIYDQLPDKSFQKISYQEEFLQKVYKNETQLNVIQYLGLDVHSFARLSFILLLNYVYDRIPHLLEQLDKPQIQHDKEYMVLANDSLEQLKVVSNTSELYQKKVSLLKILDKTVTAIGRRAFRFRLLNPITNPEILESRYFNIELLLNRDKKQTPRKNLIESTRVHLFKILDLERLTRRMATLKLTPQDMLSIDKSCTATQSLIKEIQELKNTKRHLKTIIPNETQLEQFQEFIKYYQKHLNLKKLDKFTTIKDINENIFRKKIHPNLDELQEQYDSDSHVLDEIREILNTLIKEHKDYVTGKNINRTIDPVRQDYNETYKHHLFCSPRMMKILEKCLVKIPAKHRFNCGRYKIGREDIGFTSVNRMKTVINIHTIDSSNQMIIVGLELQKRVQFEYLQFIQKMYQLFHQTITQITHFIGEIDVIQSCALNAIKHNYYPPHITTDAEDSFVSATQIRHPIIEYVNTKVPYVPHNVSLGKDDCYGILLFGANATGKSACMKSIGLNLIMAQAGMYVAAKKFEYCPYQYLFTRIEGNDDIHRAKSSFQVEMSELKTILDNVDNHSIVLGDELCRGTENISGTAIVAAGICQMSQKNASFIFATHLHGLNDIPEVKALSNVQFKHITVRYDKKRGILVYNREIKDGIGATIYGLEVCESLDMDKSFLMEANKIRKRLEKKHDNIVRIKPSNYNANVYQDTCYICQADSEHIHHIKFQSMADDNGNISQINSHKNVEHNQVALCQECHNRVHKGEITIDGYVETSAGRQLEYSDSSPSGQYVI